MTRTCWLTRTSVPATLTHEDTGATWDRNDPTQYDTSTEWQTVSYKRPRPELSEDQLYYLRMRRAEREQEMEELMSDPEARWNYERKQEIRSRIARMQCDSRYSGWSYKQLWKYVDGMLGRADEPLILRRTANNASGETEVRQRSRRSGSRRDAMIERKAEAGDLSVKLFDRDFVNQIKELRSQRTVTDVDGPRAMTQKDLAKMVNVTPAVIQEFEAGTLPYDGVLKAKLRMKFELDTD